MEVARSTMRNRRGSPLFTPTIGVLKSMATDSGATYLFIKWVYISGRPVSFKYTHMSKKTDLIRIEITILEAEILNVPGGGLDSDMVKKIAMMNMLTRQFINLTYKELSNPYASYLEPEDINNEDHIET